MEPPEPALDACRKAGADLQREREALGWSQEDFARAIFVSPRTVQNYERVGPPASKTAVIDRAFRERRADLVLQLLRRCSRDDLLAAAGRSAADLCDLKGLLSVLGETVGGDRGPA